MPSPEFWRGKRVLLTGHTGFKGAWTWLWLTRMGASVTGFALPPETEPSLAALLGITEAPGSLVGDLQDRSAVADAVRRAAPQIVLHMAAQALVRRSYANPRETFDSNVMGTVHMLDALRDAPGMQVCLVITSDKVYANDGKGRAFREGDPLGGVDPYSASKAACEIAVSAYARSFFHDRAVVATARAGNVIGGGDWSADRIVPDLWRARRAGTKVQLRHPQATRPWQHVLEPIAGYLAFVEQVSAGRVDDRTLNFGPMEQRPVTVAEIAERFQRAYGADGPSGWEPQPGEHPEEAPLLAIDAGRATAVLPWRPRLDAAAAIDWTARWYAAFDRGEDVRALTEEQITVYEDLAA